VVSPALDGAGGNWTQGPSGCPAPFDATIPFDRRWTNSGQWDLVLELVLQSNTSSGDYPADAVVARFTANPVASTGVGCNVGTGVFQFNV
jgi:hypothetical protein